MEPVQSYVESLVFETSLMAEKKEQMTLSLKTISKTYPKWAFERFWRFSHDSLGFVNMQSLSITSRSGSSVLTPVRLAGSARHTVGITCSPLDAGHDW